MLIRVFRAVADMLRWAEPWDIEDDEDPLLSREPGRVAGSGWG